MSFLRRDRKLVIGGLSIDVEIRNGKILTASIMGKTYKKNSDIAKAFNKEFLDYLEKEGSKDKIMNFDNPLLAKNAELRKMFIKQRKVLTKAITVEAEFAIDKKDKEKIKGFLESGWIKDTEVLNNAKETLESPTGVSGFIYKSMKKILDFNIREEVDKLKPDEVDMSVYTDVDLGNDSKLSESNSDDIKEGNVTESSNEEVNKVNSTIEKTQIELQQEMQKEFFIFMQKMMDDMQKLMKEQREINQQSVNQKNKTVDSTETKNDEEKSEAIVRDDSKVEVKEEVKPKVIDSGATVEQKKLLDDFENSYKTYNGEMISAHYADDRTAAKNEVEKANEQLEKNMNSIEKSLFLFNSKKEKDSLVKEIKNRLDNLTVKDTYDFKKYLESEYPKLLEKVEKSPLLKKNQKKAVKPKKEENNVENKEVDSKNLTKELKNKFIEFGKANEPLKKEDYTILEDKIAEVLSGDAPMDVKLKELHGFTDNYLAAKKNEQKATNTGVDSIVNKVDESEINLDANVQEGVTPGYFDSAEDERIFQEFSQGVKDIEIGEDTDLAKVADATIDEQNRKEKNRKPSQRVK